MLVTVGATVAIAACSEKIEAGTRVHCFAQTAVTLPIRRSMLVSDTTVTGLPPIGNEIFTMLSSHGDTLDTRVMVRYDTLPQTYTKNSIDSTIVKIDTATLVAPLVLDTLHRPSVPLTIEVYDVDTTATDTVASILALAFQAESFHRLEDVRAGVAIRHAAHSDLDRHGAQSRPERNAFARRTSWS